MQKQTTRVMSIDRKIQNEPGIVQQLHADVQRQSNGSTTDAEKEIKNHLKINRWCC